MRLPEINCGLTVKEKKFKMVKVCFVCLGNICRSPMAEFVMKEKIQAYGIQVESRGTSNWEHGNPVHRGTQKVLRENKITYNREKTSQQITYHDLEIFDVIIGMDEDNVSDLRRLSNGKFDDKIFLFRDGGVPDPWFTGDFEATYDLVNQGCDKWLARLSKSLI